MAQFPSDTPLGKRINLKNFTLMSIANYQEKCGKVTNEKAYQYFLEQYVHDIWISEKRGESHYIKAKCFASQKKDVHQLQCVINSLNGTVLSGKCSCKAG